MEIPPAKQNLCYVHFSYFGLPTLQTKALLVHALASTGILLSILFTECTCMYTAEKDSYWLRASFPCSRVIHCMVATWSIGRGFLYVVHNIPEYSFHSSKGADGGESQYLTQQTPHNEHNCQAKFVFAVYHYRVMATMHIADMSTTSILCKVSWQKITLACHSLCESQLLEITITIYNWHVLYMCLVRSSWVVWIQRLCFNTHTGGHVTALQLHF